jgi:hypothetical protein
MAERVSDGRSFAIKYLLDDDPDNVERFRREVRCLSQLDHPNIVRIASKRLLTPPYWYAMQSYKGSLFDEFPGIVSDHERIYSVFRSILDAVRYAHSEGIIHRDLKPENVLLNSDSDLVVSDFGLGRILDSKSTRKTATGIRLGTFMYCAPEQMRDFKSADPRSDVFSLGRMLYELYAGELTSAVQDLSAVPALIAPIIERATMNSPDARYQSVEKMLEDFDSAMSVILGIVEADSLDDLLEKLRAASSWTDEDLTKLISALEEIRGEDELVHTALMKVPTDLFIKLAERSRALARTLVRGFRRHAESQGWPFSYTDSIADVARRLFDELRDSEMRADLFQAVLLVGAGHNRWHVMEVAASMVQAASDANDVAGFTRVLKEHPSEAGYIQGYITRAKLHPSLRQFFPKPESE